MAQVPTSEATPPPPPPPPPPTTTTAAAAASASASGLVPSQATTPSSKGGRGRRRGGRRRGSDSGRGTGTGTGNGNGSGGNDDDGGDDPLRRPGGGGGGGGGKGDGGRRRLPDRGILNGDADEFVPGVAVADVDVDGRRGQHHQHQHQHQKHRGQQKQQLRQDGTPVKSGGRSRRRGKGRGQRHRPQQQQPGESESGSSRSPARPGEAVATAAAAAPAAPSSLGPERHHRSFSAPPSPSAAKANTSSSAAASSSSSRQPNVDKKDDSKKKKTKKKGKKGKGRYPWRAHVPRGAVDPISLDPIVAMEYPPFALAVGGDPPYDPIPVWPPIIDDGAKGGAVVGPGGTAKGNNDDTAPPLKADGGGAEGGEGEGSRGAKREGEDPAQQPPQQAKPTKPEHVHVHLFDGRVLAYYLVSTLSFIDPLNRRDLTRDELVCLDSYLARHDLGRARVVEAYDDLGVKRRSGGAGVAGQTDGGRAGILQEEARSILTMLFDPSSSSGTRGGRRHQRHPVRGREEGEGERPDDDGFRNEFERQYMGQEANRRRRRQQQRGGQGGTTGGGGGGPRHERENADGGVYADEEGMVLIDDDVNPGMRGRSYVPGAAAAATTAAAGGLWSAGRVLDRHGGADGWHGGPAEEPFPSLPIAEATPDQSSGAAPPATATATAAGSGSRSLKSIAGVVRRTDPAEVARQRRATEDARRRAELSRLSFDDRVSVGAAAAGGVDGSSGAMTQQPPSEALLRRNRLLADALGVVPSTVRSGGTEHQLSSGWARPVDAPRPRQYDEFGNELGRTEYPPALLQAARDAGGEFLLKLERRWRSFLLDDRESSLSLRPMDRERRRLVHEYSDFWRLGTESFDAEPRRYVHCVKMRDTAAPNPLLSEAAASHRRGGAPPPTMTTTNMPSTAVRGASVGAPFSSGTTGAAPVVAPRRDEPRLAASAAAPDGFVPPPPRSTPASAPQGAMFNLDDDFAPRPPSPTPDAASSSPPRGLPLSMTAAPIRNENPAPRFSSLDDRARPRLVLAPRTLPRELPAYHGGDAGARDREGRTRRMENDHLRRIMSDTQLSSRAKEAREREEEEERRGFGVLADEFDDDDDEDSDDGDGGGGGGGGGGRRGERRVRVGARSVWDDDDDIGGIDGTSSSDWGVGVAEYSGSSDDE